MSSKTWTVTLEGNDENFHATVDADSAYAAKVLTVATARDVEGFTMARFGGAYVTVVPANSRQYVIGLPVVITVDDEGNVTAEVDLSEAADLHEAPPMYDVDTDREIVRDDEEVDADIDRVMFAVANNLVTVR